ncbi:hypothetical protein J6590_011193 [Homalodisca vitripennis]|nr:hypothetical protein J6590_011193 [Homalodisca vitripennis]
MSTPNTHFADKCHIQIRFIRASARIFLVSDFYCRQDSVLQGDEVGRLGVERRDFDQQHNWGFLHNCSKVIDFNRSRADLQQKGLSTSDTHTSDKFHRIA